MVIDEPTRAERQAAACVLLRDSIVAMVLLQIPAGRTAAIEAMRQRYLQHALERWPELPSKLLHNSSVALARDVTARVAHLTAGEAVPTRDAAPTDTRPTAANVRAAVRDALAPKIKAEAAPPAEPN